jgi:threonine/homoserine/homoserine lactone efflux protein
VLALTGLAFLVQNNIAKGLLSLAGMLLMLKLAWDAFRTARHDNKLEMALPTRTAGRGDFANGAFLSIGNPLNLVFWTGLGSTVFTSLPEGPQPVHFAIFFTGFLAGAILWCFFMAGLVAWGRRFVTPVFFRGVNLLCGVALTFCALQLGWQLIQNLS